MRRFDAPADEPSAYSQDIQNLLYMPESAIWLIDLVGVETFTELTKARKVQNLARLNASFFTSPMVSLPDRLRFLKAYRSWSIHQTAGDWKIFWKALAVETLAKVEKNRRAGRVLA